MKEARLKAALTEWRDRLNDDITALTARRDACDTVLATMDSADTPAASREKETKAAAVALLHFLHDAGPPPAAPSPALTGGASPDPPARTETAPASALPAAARPRSFTAAGRHHYFCTGLVLDYDPSVTDVHGVSKVEISSAGKVHLIWGTSDEEYLKIMKEVTPLRDKQALDDLRYHIERSATNWARALSTFIDYLISEDERWVQIPAHAHYDGQRSVVKRLRSVRNSVLKFGR